MFLLCRKVIVLVFLAIIILQLSGCGETVQGVSKDVRRVGKGVRTIFIRDGE
jgi:predicted small secreted protein